MSDHAKVAIFWDYENCSPPSGSCGLGYDIANNIGRMARVFGSVTTFKAYLDISAQSSKSVVLRSELQSSGISMIDCPHNGKKDVVDKMILVDMLAFAVDHPIPATVILITGDRDYAYAVSTLRLRNYQVILIVPSPPHTPSCLENQASLVVDWSAAVLKPRTETVTSSQAIRQAHPDIDANLVAKLSRELEERSLDDSGPSQHTLPNPYVGASRIRRTSARDLLVPSKFSKSLESFEPSQSVKHPLDSPRNSSAAGDASFGGLPIPRTPSRSRHASVDAPIPTRARSATVVTQTALNQVAETAPSVGSLRHPSVSTARRLSIHDIACVPGLASASPPELPSLDALELSLLYDGPPSSIVIRSPLERARSVDDAPPTTEPTSSPSSPSSDPLTSPFVITKTSAGLKSRPGSCNDQSYVGITTSVTPSKMLDRTASICDTSRTEDAGAPKEVNLEVDLITNDDNGASTRSFLGRAGSKEGTQDSPDVPNSNYRSDASPPMAHASFVKEGELVPVVASPGDDHAAPAAAITLSSDPSLGFGNDVNSTQPTPLSRVLNKPSDSAQAATPTCPTVTSPSLPLPAEPCQANESDRRETWMKFQPLIHLLLVNRERGIARPSRSIVAVYLVQSDKEVYQRVGVSRFKDYTALAEKAGVIELGGMGAEAWIALDSSWFRSEATMKNTQTLSKEVSSPATKLSDAIGEKSRSSPIGRSIASQPSTPSPKLGLLNNSDSPSNSPSVRNRTLFTLIHVKFQPLVNILVRLRDNGTPRSLRSLVGQLLGEEVYARAGVLGFKEYIHLASNAQLVECGGIGGHAWIRLHPDVQV